MHCWNLICIEKFNLIISGGIRNGADVAKAMALGADAVSIGSSALIALGDNDPKWEKDYKKLGNCRILIIVIQGKMSCWNKHSRS